MWDVGNFLRELVYYSGCLIDLQMISFPFSPFQYSLELESKESKITISKPSLTLQVLVNAKWKCRNRKAGGQEKFRMHHLKTMWLFSSSSKCFGIILITDLVVLLHKDHLVNKSKWGHMLQMNLQPTFKTLQLCCTDEFTIKSTTKDRY